MLRNSSPDRSARQRRAFVLLLALMVWSCAPVAWADVAPLSQDTDQSVQSSDPLLQEPVGSLEFPAPGDFEGEPETFLPAYDPIASESWDEDVLEGGEAWDWHILPDGLIYKSYLAGAKESRMASFWAYEKDEGWIWDNTLGGRAPIWRYGTSDSFRPEGWQMDIEGAALLRLDTEEDRDLVAADFRFGVPLTYGVGRYQTKLAYYHLSSHLGDEYMLKHPEFQRINYSRDVLVWGHSYYLTDDLRVYGEAGYAFFHDVSEPWEFQFGLDYSPAAPTGIRGAPFFAFNGALREEVDFGGNFVVQVGRQWRGADSGHLFRAGIEYYNGKSDQFSFFDQFEEKIGIAIWYDF